MCVCVHMCAWVCKRVPACPAPHTCTGPPRHGGVLFRFPSALLVLPASALARLPSRPWVSRSAQLQPGLSHQLCEDAPFACTPDGRCRLAPGHTWERAVCPLPSRDEAGVLEEVSAGVEESWGLGRREGWRPASTFCPRAQECNEVRGCGDRAAGGGPAGYLPPCTFWS